MTGSKKPGEIFRAKINPETSTIAWKELRRGNRLPTAQIVPAGWEFILKKMVRD